MNLSESEIRRYGRHLALKDFGIAQQLRLKKAKVLIVGCGGLGCPCALYLAAAGVGEITLIDDDKVEESNLHRQILFTQDDIGKSKALIASQKLQIQNPLIIVKGSQTRLTSDNALQIIANHDIVIDGTDNFPTRYLVNDACVILNKVNIYGSISQFEGQVSVFNYEYEKGIRSPNYRDIYPAPPNVDMVPDCATGGVLGVLPGLIGTIQATEAIKVITGIGEILSGEILLFDSLDMSSRKLRIKKNKNLKITELINYDDFCGINNNNKGHMKEITVQELKEWKDNSKDFQLVDVREQHEFEFCNLSGDLIPLNTIMDDPDKISKDKPVVVHCRSGARSANAIMALSERFGFDNLLNLKGGIQAWSKEIDPSVPQY